MRKFTCYQEYSYNVMHACALLFVIWTKQICTTCTCTVYVTCRHWLLNTPPWLSAYFWVCYFSASNEQICAHVHVHVNNIQRIHMYMYVNNIQIGYEQNFNSCTFVSYDRPIQYYCKLSLSQDNSGPIIAHNSIWEVASMQSLYWCGWAEHTHQSR